VIDKYVWNQEKGNDQFGEKILHVNQEHASEILTKIIIFFYLKHNHLIILSEMKKNYGLNVYDEVDQTCTI
jgi:hypothetical protein